MAILEKSFIGKVKGKLGDMVIYEAGGQIRVRMKPAGYTDRKSPKQLAHRAKVKGVSALYHEIDAQIMKYWKELTRGTAMNGYNLFLSRNVGNLDGEGKVVDYAKVVVCQGDLTVPSWAKAEEKAPGVLEVSWDKDAPGEYEYNDYLQMVVYCDWGKQEWGFEVDDFHGAQRQDGRAEWRFPEGVKGEVHVYGFFKGKYSEGISESFYFGRFEL